MTDLVSVYTLHLTNAINNANNKISKLTDDILLKIGGMTGIKSRHFYNNLLNIENSRFLDIGCNKGASTCSAMYDNSATVVCIDDWSEFIYNDVHNGVDRNDPIQQFMTNTDKHKGNNNLTFYNEDCFKIDTNKLGKFNIYLYDADHSYESQYKALTYYINNMDDIFIFVVEYWNDENVRNGTFDAIRDLKLNNLWNHEIRLTDDNSHSPPELAYTTWQNGCYICILSK